MVVNSSQWADDHFRFHGYALLETIAVKTVMWCPLLCLLTPVCHQVYTD
jgi:hypothetical protein